MVLLSRHEGHPLTVRQTLPAEAVVSDGETHVPVPCGTEEEGCLTSRLTLSQDGIEPTAIFECAYAEARNMDGRKTGEGRRG